MHDLQLQILQDQGWRFCNIPNVDGQPTKGPRVKGWAQNPITQEHVPEGNNIGVVLGEASNGVLAIDFDGPSSWGSWLEQVGIPFKDIDTVTWSSGKDGRAQMAFYVPQDFWHVMPTKFVVTGKVQREQLEFRWGNDSVGFQSVLPPSMHPELMKQYQWLRSPSQCKVQTIPIKLLEFVLTYKPPQKVVEEIVPTKNIDELTQYDVDSIEELLQAVKKKHPVLEYETWLRVTFATFKELGTGAGAILMQQYYPESLSGEYAKLSTTYNPSKSPGKSSLRFMVRDNLIDPLQGKRRPTRRQHMRGLTL
jgi:hypothetical protein